MAYYRRIAFNDTTPTTLAHIPYGTNWPVVYIINNDTEAYVGETVDAVTRTSQHWQNPERRILSGISIISDDTFNKSVILDLEAFLIKHMSADGKYRLQNGNAGLHLHNYFNRTIYEKRFHEIWDHLRRENLARSEAAYIENSDIFKYSPYNALSADQFQTVASIIRDLRKAISDHTPMTAVVQGGPGTGKTILGVYIMKLLSERNTNAISGETEYEAGTLMLIEALRLLPYLKIGFVVPMQSLRKTMHRVFSSISGLREDMILSPNQVPKRHYDLLIVDEAHRLRQRKSLNQYPAFDANNERLGFSNEGTELDWILKCSDYQILFYDKMQSIKPCDINRSRFDELIGDINSKAYKLHTQFRCKGGEEYIAYIREIFSDMPPVHFTAFDEYDLKLFDDVDIMVQAIRQQDRKFGLCRTVAGYAWKWVSKDKPDLYDINIDGHQYRWNTVAEDWVNSPNATDEVGCIHTVQGYDLNYTGIIIGPELDYVQGKGLVIRKDRYMDPLGRAVGGDDILLRDYILNIYGTLMTRGIRGTYVYACNDGMRKYLNSFLPV